MIYTFRGFNEKVVREGDSLNVINWAISLVLCTMSLTNHAN